MAGGLPDADFASRPLALTTVPAGSVWRRIYETRYRDPLGYGLGLNRFSDPTGKAFGLVYLGASARVAFVETVLRDRADGRGADCIVEEAEILKRSMATLTPASELRLVDLTGVGGVRLGVPSDVVGARNQTLAQQWSAAFYAHPDQPDGILYPSRLIEDRCIALYDRAVPKLTATTSPRLIDCGAELAVILDELVL